MTALLFIGLVGVMAVLVLGALRQAAAGWPLMIGVALVYLVIPGVLASRGMLDRYTPLPAPALVMVMALTICTLTITLASPGRRLIAAVGLPALVGFQAFRIPVEWLLHRLYQEGTVPVQMTYAGRNFDVVTGVTAAALGVWVARRGRSRNRLRQGFGAEGLVLAWNVLGLALLVNIVTIAILSTPVPFRRFLDGPPNMLPSLWPYVWLPTFLVQVALAGHVLVFRAVRVRQALNDPG
jgi:hypothetical protein